MPRNPGRFAPKQRGRPGALTRERIIEAALEYADRGALGDLTIRSLAADLGVAPMSLYRHVENKDEILDGVVDALLARSGLPDGDLPWDAWLAEAAERLRALLLDHPMALAVFGDHPVATPAALARMEAALDILERAGFDTEAAVQGYAAVHVYTLGFASLEASRARHQLETGRSSREVDRYWRVYFATLDAEEHPHLVEAAPNLSTFTSDHQFRFGLDHLLAGLRTDLSRTGGNNPRP